MNFFKRFFFLFPVLSFLPVSLLAQDIDVVKCDAVIFRGPVVEAYPRYVRGTAYLYSPEFQKESIVHNRKLYYNVRLNLDVFRDQVCVTVPESTIRIVLDSKLVETFTVCGDRFVNASGIDGLERCFYQQLYDGDCMLLKEIVKEYVRVDRVNLEFYPRVRYFLVKDGKAVRIRGIKAFKKTYPHKKKALGKYYGEILEAYSHTDKEKIYAVLAEFAEKQ